MLNPLFLREATPGFSFFAFFQFWVYKSFPSVLIDEGLYRELKLSFDSQAHLWLLLADDTQEEPVPTAPLASSRYMEMLLSAKLEKEKKETARSRQELKKAEKRVKELDKILAKLYEDQALGKISEARYQAMAPGYEKEQESLNERRDQLTAQLAHTQEVQDNVEQFVPLIQKYTDIQELTPHILNELVEKIVVHEKKVEEDGSKSQMVEIHYKFVGCIDLGAMLG